MPTPQQKTNKILSSRQKRKMRKLNPVKPIRETSLLTEDPIASVNQKLKKEIKDAKIKMDIANVIKLTNRQIRKKFKKDPLIIDFILKEKERAKIAKKEFIKLLRKEKKEKRKLKKRN
jgi:hypothetical protein